jgi:ribonucleotide reductase alpha subunit
MTKTIKEQLSEERKELQAKGLLPDWFITPGWQMFKQKYLYEAEGLSDTYERIAKTAAKHMPDSEKWEKKFYDILWKGWLACSTPVLANMGLPKRGCPVSCSGQYIGDSVYEFYANRLETAMLTKNGFGTSAYLGDIRPRGANIGNGNGKASGTLPVFKMFVRDMVDVAQGGVRRGSWAGYIPIDHGDFYEVCTYLLNQPDDLNIGWNVSEEFINRLEAGDEDAITRFQKAMKTKAVTGKGYFNFVDKTHAQQPQMYHDLGLRAKASNLCVSPETMLTVRKDFVGATQIKIADLKDEWVDVWNGEEWSHVQVRQTSEDSALIRVEFQDGNYLDCTAYHKFYLDGSNNKPTRAWDLKSGDVLESWYKAGSATDDLTKLIPGQLWPTRPMERSIVKRLIWLDRRAPTYCVTEPKRGRAMFNGVVTGNCTEITLHSDEEHSFTCVLSSMNLHKYDEWKDTDAVFTATVFLDCVAQEFIEIGRGIPGLEKSVRFTEKGRALGLGTLGFHSYLQKHMIPMESLEANLINTKIFKNIKEQADKATRWLAEELGEPEWCKGYGVRNTHLLAIAPNTTSALICGGVSQGIEPVVANAYTQPGAAGELDRINPEFIKLLESKGKYNDRVIENVSENLGSVQHLDFLTDEEKLVFKTAYEIDQKVLVRLASNRQPYICQGQSLNLFFAADEDEAYIAEVHREAFLDKNIKSLYYMRTLAGVQASKDDECLSCEG